MRTPTLLATALCLAACQSTTPLHYDVGVVQRVDASEPSAADECIGASILV